MSGDSVISELRVLAGRRMLGVGGALALASAGLFLFSGSVGATTACTAPSAPSPGVAKNIDTISGCNVGGAQADNPVTGWITINFPGDSASATGVDAFSQPPGASGPVLSGTYTITFSSCTGGPTTDDASYTYTVAAGDTYPSEPSSTPSTPLMFTADSAGGTVECAYSVTQSPTLSTSGKGGNTFTNDIWVNFSNNTSAQAASNSVGPPVPPEAIPEAPLAIGLPIAALVLFGGAFFIAVRRRRAAAPSV
jgi:hypothetical protein